jgi:phage terminase small subunit|tara:strand:+ start:383 stop:907 length:525 start_codon:yes stop_codon:yes gene_type:complete
MKLVDKSLTDLQKRFARIHVEAHYGNQHLSNTECAIKAGYSPDSAYQRAYELLNPRISPHVVNYIGKLKEDFRIKNNIDPDKHMARLNHLGNIAEQNKMIGVSLRAEELRGKVAGYYIDKIITKNQNVEGDGEKTTEELEEKMVTILANHKHLLWNEEELKEMAKEQLNGKTKK